jgi:hypothetical protein
MRSRTGCEQKAPSGESRARACGACLRLWAGCGGGGGREHNVPDACEEPPARHSVLLPFLQLRRRLVARRSDAMCEAKLVYAAMSDTLRRNPIDSIALEKTGDIDTTAWHARAAKPAALRRRKPPLSRHATHPRALLQLNRRPRRTHGRLSLPLRRVDPDFHRLPATPLLFPVRARKRTVVRGRMREAQ